VAGGRRPAPGDQLAGRAAGARTGAPHGVVHGRVRKAVPGPPSAPPRWRCSTARRDWLAGNRGTRSPRRPSPTRRPGAPHVAQARRPAPRDQHERRPAGSPHRSSARRRARASASGARSAVGPPPPWSPPHRTGDWLQQQTVSLSRPRTGDTAGGSGVRDRHIPPGARRSRPGSVATTRRDAGEKVTAVSPRAPPPSQQQWPTGGAVRSSPVRERADASSSTSGCR
jgi:hypothetical protein